MSGTTHETTSETVPGIASETVLETTLANTEQVSPTGRLSFIADNGSFGNDSDSESGTPGEGIAPNPESPAPHSPKRRKNAWVIAASFALTAFTVFVLLDAFAIARVQQTVQEADLSSIVAAQEKQATAEQAGQTSAESASAANSNAESSSSATSASSSDSGSAASADSKASSESASKASGSSAASSSSDSSSSSNGKQSRGPGGKHRSDGSSSSSAPKKPSQGSKPSSSSSSDSSGSSRSSGSSKPSPSNSGRSKSSKSNGSSSSSSTTSTLVAGSGSASSTGTSIGSYSDDNMKIEVSSVRAYDTDIYVADIQVSSAEYLKTALAQNAFGRNLKDTTSNMAEANNAVLAINGDYYGFRDDGYVVRNGVLYRDTASSGTDALVVYGDGSMGSASQDSTTAQQLIDSGAWQVLSFGPVLVKDGAIAVDADDEVSRSMGSNPRTAIGMVSPLHYVVVVSDGRTNDNAGLSLDQLAQVLVDNGATFAYNLDGGGSTTLYFKGEVLNNPTSGNIGGERSVSDIVYFG